MRTTPYVLFGALAATSVAVAACSLFVTNPDLTGGDLDAALLDAPTGDASPLEDGAVSDATTVVDAGPDAHFCDQVTPAPLFCDDFDRGLTLGSGWDKVTMNRATLSLVTAGAKSPPAALKAEFDNPGGTAAAILSRTLARKGASKVSVDFDIKAASAQGSLKFVGIVLGSGYAVSFKMTPQLEQAVPIGGGNFDYSSNNATKGLTLDVFTHFRMQISFPPPDAGVGTVRVEIDGAPAIDNLALDSRAAGLYTDNFTVNLGITYGTTGTTNNLIDNVVIRAE